ncbi:hypothetical protein LCGC14_0906860 [marine sediment metagenome]|uniref:Tyr recombinase domain-containing protein n=1 Tax=marine sediment metagenome TaxID=412755 RepID=A0A0F9RDP2_9ZZZZ
MIGCRPLTPNEFALVLRAFHGRDELRNRLLFVLGVSTGFRISELLSVSIRDVHREGRLVQRIRVRRRDMKGGRPTPGRARGSRVHARTAILTPLARKHLELWLGHLALEGALAPDAPLFRSRKGTARAISRVQAYRVLRAAFEYCELDLTSPGTHTMRKTFADTMYEALGQNIFKLQKALGHASPSSTVAYLSFNEEEIDEAAMTAWSQPEETHKCTNLT